MSKRHGVFVCPQYPTMLRIDSKKTLENLGPKKHRKRICTLGVSSNDFSNLCILKVKFGRSCKVMQRWLRGCWGGQSTWFNMRVKKKSRNSAYPIVGYPIFFLQVANCKMWGTSASLTRGISLCHSQSTPEPGLGEISGLHILPSQHSKTLLPPLSISHRTQPSTQDHPTHTQDHPGTWRQCAQISCPYHWRSSSTGSWAMPHQSPTNFRHVVMYVGMNISQAGLNFWCLNGNFQSKNQHVIERCLCIKHHALPNDNMVE